MTQMGGQQPLRTALIGCGSMGSYYMDELVGATSRQILPIGHAEVIKTHPCTTLVAGADPDLARLDDFGRRWDVQSLYVDHREMLEQERPDIVCIASPPELHLQHVVDCAERGVKGVFCEKPLAPTLREADEMLRACQKHGLLLSINHTRRGDPYNIRAKELLENGDIGDVKTIVATWSGRLFLTGTHVFDLVNYFVGDGVQPSWVMGHAEASDANMRARLTQRGADVGGTAYIAYENGIRAFFNGRDGQAHGFKVDIYGTKGAISLDSHEAQLWKEVPGERSVELVRFPFPQMMQFTAPMSYLLGDLIEAIESGREPVSNGQMARRSLEQILATHYSSQHDNTKVSFPFEDLDMRPPFRWFDETGGTLYRATG